MEQSAAQFRRAEITFGFETEPRFIGDEKTNNCGVVASQTGTMLDANGAVNPTVVAQSSIGQSSVQMTPLQGAMIAATVANGGRLMRPYIVDRLQKADLSNADRTTPKELSRPIDGTA